MSSTGVDPLGFLKPTVNVNVHQETLKHFILIFTDRFSGHADLFIYFSQQDNFAKCTKEWFNEVFA